MRDVPEVPSFHSYAGGPKDDVNMRILPSGSKAQQKWNSRNEIMVCRILMFVRSVGAICTHVPC